MLVKIKVSALRDTHWHEYALRFGLGGLATVCTGLIAEIFGPATGGLFLAFPAVFCASATLIEKHERDRKQKAGLPGTAPRAAGGGAGRNWAPPSAASGCSASRPSCGRCRAAWDPFRHSLPPAWSGCLCPSVCGGAGGACAGYRD